MAENKEENRSEGLQLIEFFEEYNRNQPKEKKIMKTLTAEQIETIHKRVKELIRPDTICSATHVYLRLLSLFIKAEQNK